MAAPLLANHLQRDTMESIDTLLLLYYTPAPAFAPLGLWALARSGLSTTDQPVDYIVQGGDILLAVVSRAVCKGPE